MQYNWNEHVLKMEEERISGIPKSEIESFVERNQLRYIDIFRKYENKKFFFHFNWSAMFLTVYWMFYRRMYKNGVLFLLCLFIFTTLIFSISYISFKDDIIAIREKERNAMFYKSESSSDEFTDLSGYFTNNQKVQEQMKQELYVKVFCFVIFPLFLFSLFFGLISDCLYRNYILRKINVSGGGVSKLAILGAFILMQGYSLIIDEVRNMIMRFVFK